jgi:hypothetical protein
MSSETSSELSSVFDNDRGPTYPIFDTLAGTQVLKF